MLSIVLIILIWTCNLMPLWANIVCTILLAIRFCFRAFITTVKFMDTLKDKTITYQEEGYYI